MNNECLIDGIIFLKTIKHIHARSAWHAKSFFVLKS